VKNYHHLARRVLNRPQLVEPGYAAVLLGAISDRLGIETLTDAQGDTFQGPAVADIADDYEPRDSEPLARVVDGIAIIPITGTLTHNLGSLRPVSGMTGYDGILTQFDDAIAQPGVEGVLFWVDSPGGEVSGCFDLSDYIFSMRSVKPIWAVADEMAASAAYAISSAASRIIAPRTAQVGSIGVLTAHVDRSQELKQAGRKVTLIYRAAHKVDGNPYGPLPADVKAEVQAEINELYNLFVSTVARNRGLSTRIVESSESRLVMAMDSAQYSMIDQILPAHSVVAEFRQYLDRQRGGSVGGSAMFGLGKKRHAEAHAEAARLLETKLTEEAPEPEATPEPEPERAEDTPGPEAEPERAKEAPEPEATPEPERAEEAERAAASVADAREVVAMCREAGVESLATQLIADQATAEVVKRRVADARDLRDVFTAGGFAELAGRAAAAGMRLDMARDFLAEVAARMGDASGEIDGTPPEGTESEPAPKGLNVVSFYKNHGAK